MRAERIGTWIDGKFKTTINPKDGHAVSDCIDAREKRVLEFVIPILYSEKPGRITKEIGNTVFKALSGEYKVSWGQVIHELVEKLVLVLGKRKPTLVSPCLFHQYSKFECLRREEMQQIEVARECLVMGVAPEVEREVMEVDSDRGSLNPDVRQQTPGPSPRSKEKATFRSPKGKSPVRNTDGKDLSALDFYDDPFSRVQSELDHVQTRYQKMELVLKGATKLLGDCKAGNISKEIWKLKEEDNSELKTHITHLKLRIVGRQETVKAQDEKIEELKVKAEAIEQIREYIGHPGDVVNKAHLFDNEVKKEDHLSVQKILTILVKYGYKMEEMLGLMQKLLPDPSAVGTSEPKPKGTVPLSPPSKAKHIFEDLKSRHQERQLKDAVEMAAKIVMPNPEASSAAVLVVLPSGKEKKTEAESGSRAASLDPGSQRSGKKKEQIPMPEVQELESEEEEDEGSTESSEEEEPSTPRPELKNKRELRSSGKKKPGPVYQSPFAPKRQSKIPAKGEGSNKKPQGK